MRGLSVNISRVGQLTAPGQEIRVPGLGLPLMRQEGGGSTGGEGGGDSNGGGGGDDRGGAGAEEGVTSPGGIDASTTGNGGGNNATGAPPRALKNSTSSEAAAGLTEGANEPAVDTLAAQPHGDLVLTARVPFPSELRKKVFKMTMGSGDGWTEEYEDEAAQRLDEAVRAARGGDAAAGNLSGSAGGVNRQAFVVGAAEGGEEDLMLQAGTAHLRRREQMEREMAANIPLAATPKDDMAAAMSGTAKEEGVAAVDAAGAGAGAGAEGGIGGGSAAAAAAAAARSQTAKSSHRVASGDDDGDGEAVDLDVLDLDEEAEAVIN